MDILKENKSYYFVLLLFFSLLPFVFLSSISDPFLLPRQLLTTALLFFILFQLFKNNKTSSTVAVNSTTLLFLGFIIFSGLSFFSTQIASISHAVFSKYVTFFAFYILLNHLIKDGLLTSKQLYLSTILFGLLALLITILAFANKTINGQNLFRQVDLMSGTFGNKNFLSSILFCCLPFYFIGISISKRIKTVSFIAIGTTVFLVVLLRTRTVLIATIVFLFLVLCYFIKQKLSKKTVIKLIISIVSLVSIGFYYLLTIKDDFLASSNLKTLYFHRLLSSSTFNSRLEFWQQAIYIIKDNFFNGIGVGNWIAVYPKYGLETFSDSKIQNGILVINNTHNDFLQVFLETGFLGFVCYFGLFAMMLYQAFWLSKNEQKSTDRKNATYLLFFVICYLIIGFFDFPLTRIEHQVVLLVAFSLINTKYFIAKKPKSITLKSTYVYVACTFLLLYSTTIIYFRIDGEKHLIKALLAEKNHDNTTFLYELSKAKNPYFETDNFAKPLDWHLGKIYFSASSFEESLEYYSKAYQINPFSIAVNNDLASAYAKNNKNDEAIKHYKIALNISPNYIDARLNLAATYYNTEQFDDAFETIDNCETNLKNDFYVKILTPIIEKKLNRILGQANDEQLNNYYQNKIKSEEDLRNLYFDYKKNKITFDTYLTTLNNSK